MTVTSGSSSADYDFGNYRQGTVSGMKFEDENADGSNAADPADKPLENWTIKAYADDGDGALSAGEAGAPAAATATTDADGKYTLTLDPGDYVVCETLEPSWFQSAPSNVKCEEVTGAGEGGHAVTVTSGSSSADYDFGNYRQGTVSGMKFEDENADGSNAADPADAPLEDWTIRAFEDDGDGTLSATEASAPAAAYGDDTDADGKYTLTLDPGDYVVCEQLEASWFQSAPSNVKCKAVTGAGEGGHAVTVASGSSSADYDFGNYRQGTVSGMKFEDDNADGSNAADPADKPLEDWTIKAYADDGDGTLSAAEASAPAADSAQTDADGKYTLTLDPGKYVVCETLKSSWAQSAPANEKCKEVTTAGKGGHAVTVTSASSSAGNDFGNFRQGTVSGMKFEDDNADGTNAADPADAPLDNWTIRAFKDDGDGTLSATEAAAAAAATTTTTARTASTRSRSIPVPMWFARRWSRAGSSRRRRNEKCKEVSGAGKGGHAVTVTSGSSSAGNDFGNFRQGTVSGLKFEDDNADGSNAADPADKPLDNWTIRAFKDDGDGTLSATEAGAAAAATTTTGADGKYTLTLDPGAYVVCETLKTNWLQSAPANEKCKEVSGAGKGGHAVTVSSGGSVSAKDFGNYQRGTIAGLKFEDENSDGQNAADPADNGLGNWTIRAYTDDGDGTLSTAEGTAAPAASTTTAADGTYLLSLTPGNYVVCEVAQTNWTQTKPNVATNTKCKNATGAAPGGYAVAVTPGSSDTAKDFGNAHFDSNSTMTDSAFRLVDDLTPWTIGDFEILLNPKNEIVATNPGQFYYHQRATNTSGGTTSMAFTINWPCQFQTQISGGQPIHAYVQLPSDSPNTWRDWLSKSSNISWTNTNTSPACIKTTSAGPPGTGTITANDVPAGAKVWVNVHLDYALKGWTAPNASFGNPPINYRPFQSTATSSGGASYSSSSLLGRGKKVTVVYGRMIHKTGAAPMSNVWIRLTQGTNTATTVTDLDGNFVFFDTQGCADDGLVRCTGMSNAVWNFATGNNVASKLEIMGEGASPASTPTYPATKTNAIVYSGNQTFATLTGTPLYTFNVTKNSAYDRDWKLGP